MDVIEHLNNFQGSLKQIMKMQGDSIMNEDQKSSKVKQLLKNTNVMSKIMLMRIFDFFDFLSIRRDFIQKDIIPMDLKDILVKF